MSYLTDRIKEIENQKGQYITNRVNAMQNERGLNLNTQEGGYGQQWSSNYIAQQSPEESLYEQLMRAAYEAVGKTANAALNAGYNTFGAYQSNPEYDEFRNWYNQYTNWINGQQELQQQQQQHQQAASRYVKPFGAGDAALDAEQGRALMSNYRNYNDWLTGKQPEQEAMPEELRQGFEKYLDLGWITQGSADGSEGMTGEEEEDNWPTGVNAARGTSRLLGNVFDNAENRVSGLRNSEYAKLMQMQDYAELSRAGESKRRWFGGDDLYDYINNINGEREQADYAMRRGIGAQDYGKYAFMTEDEIGVYNYLYATQGKKAAKKFLKELEPELNKQWYSGASAYNKQQAVEHPWLYSAATVAAQPTRMLSSTLAEAQDFARVFTGDEIDPYSGLRMASRMTSDVRGAIGEDSRLFQNMAMYNPDIQNAALTYDQFGSGQSNPFNPENIDTETARKMGNFAYQTVMSAADSAVNMAMASGIAGEYGALRGFDLNTVAGRDALMKATNVIGSLTMSSEVMSLGVAEAKEKGYSDLGAFAVGAIRGAIEYASEAIGGEWVIKNIKDNPLNFFKTMLLNMIPEGVEEVMSDVGNGVVNLLVDAMFGTEESGIPELMRYFSQEGWKEENPVLSSILSLIGADDNPELATILYLLGEENLSFLGGALATVGTSTVQSSNMNRGISATAQQLGTTNENVVQLMQDYETESPADIFNMAQELGVENEEQLRQRTGEGRNAGQVLEDIYQSDQANKDRYQIIADAFQKQNGVKLKNAEIRQLAADMELGTADEETFLLAARNAYKMGYGGFTLQEAIRASDAAAQLTETQFRHAFELGQKRAGQTTQTATGSVQERLDASLAMLGENASQAAQAYEEGQDIDTYAEAMYKASALYAANGQDVRAIAEQARSGERADIVGRLTDAQLDTAIQIGQKMAAESAGKVQQATERYAALREQAAKLAAEGKTPTGKKGSFTLATKGGMVEGKRYTAVDESKLSKRQKDTVAAVQAVTELLGLDVTVVKGEGNWGGAYFSGGRIVLNINSGMNLRNFSKSIAAGSFAHEMTHWLAEYAKDEYDALKKITTGHLSAEQLDKLVQEQLKSQPNLSPDEALDEVIANACQPLLKDSKAFEQLARQNMTLAERILDFLKEFTQKIRDAFGDINFKDDLPIYHAVQALEGHLDEMQEAFDKAVLAARENMAAERAVNEKAAGEGGEKLQAWDGQTIQDYEAEAAVRDAMDHADGGYDNLIKVGRMPKFLRNLIGIDGDLYVYRDHLYEDIVTEKQAREDNRYHKRGHYHGIGEAAATQAITALENPALTVNDTREGENPNLVMVLPVLGPEGTPLVAAVGLYENEPINGKFSIKPHITLSIYEKLEGVKNEKGGTYKGLAAFIDDAVDGGKVISYDKNMSDDLPVIAQRSRLGNVTASSLNKNLTQFQKEVKDYRAKNKIYYQLIDVDPVQTLDTTGYQKVLVEQTKPKALMQTWDAEDLLDANAKKLVSRIGRNAPQENRWTGIQNSAVLSQANLTDEDIRGMVAGITGTSTQEARNYIGKTIMALDTNMDWSWLSFNFARDYADRADHSVRGFYDNDNRKIEISKEGRKLNTVAHEMGHALDYQWARDLFGGKSDQTLSGNTFHPGMIIDESGQQFYRHFRAFMYGIKDSVQFRNTYEMREEEIFARFVARFVEWTRQTAGKYEYTSEAQQYKDRFTEDQYVAFARLLQEKAAWDAKHRPARPVTEQVAAFNQSTATSEEDVPLFQTWSEGEVYNDRALVSEETLDKWMSSQWFGSSNPDYAQAFITSMSPSQFLKLTTVYDESRIREESKNYPMDAVREASERQPIQLMIDTETGQVVGHEGRHRMAALERNGVYEVPVLLFDSSNKYSKKPMKELRLLGQNFNGHHNISRATVFDVYPLNRNHRQQIVNLYSKQTYSEGFKERYNGAQTVRFQQWDDTGEDTARESRGRQSAYARLQSENALLKQTVKELKRLSGKQATTLANIQKQLQLTKDPETRLGDAKKLARSLLKEYSSTADVNTVAEAIKAVGDYLLNTNTGEITEAELKGRARAAAMEILDSASETMGFDGEEIQVNPYDAYIGEASEDLANRIVMDAMEGVLRPTAPTKADKQQARTQALRDRIQELKKDNKLQQREAASLYQTIYDLSLQLDRAQSRYESLRQASQRRLAQVRTEGAARAAEIKANERARAEGLLEEQKQHYLDIAKRARERRENTASRSKIRKLIDDLNRRLAKPTEKKYVPQELIRLTVDVLSVIDTDSGRGGEKLAAKLERIRTMYDSYQKDPKYSAVYDEVAAEMLADMCVKVADTGLYKMNQDQLETVYKTLKALTHIIDTAVKIKIGTEEYNAWEQAQEMTQETREIPKAQKGWLKQHWIPAGLRPSVAFNRFGGFKKNSAWSRAFRLLNDGQLKQTDITMRLSLPFAELVNNAAAMRDFTGVNFFNHVDPTKLIDIGLKDADGNAIKVTHDIAVGIYMDLLNEDNRRHFIRGGKTIPNMKEYYTGRGGFGMGTVRAVGISTELSELMHQQREAKAEGDISLVEDLQAQIDDLIESGESYADTVQKNIEKQLTDFDKQWIELTQQLMDKEGKRYLNETTMDVYGIEKATVDHYYPITSDPNYLASSFESITKDMNLENVGFMKERVQSGNPTLAMGVSSVVNNQIQRVAQYAGLMPAIRNFNKIWSKQAFGYSDSLKNAVNDVFGKEGGQYVENLIADLTGSRGVGEDSLGLSRLFGWLRSNLAQTSLTLNIRVALAQAASYPTAAAELGWGPLAKAFARGGKNNTVISRADADLIAKWSPLLYHRMQGYSSVELGDIKNSQRLSSRLWKKARWATGWIQAVDGATVGRLWYAAEYWVQDNMPSLEKGTDEYYQAVAQKFNDVVEKTQPNYTTMQRPQILRDPNEMVRMLTMFMTQRLQNFNILFDATASYQKARADKANGRNGVTQADVAEARTDLVRAVSSQLAQAAVYVGFKLFADALLRNMKAYRDDDDGELTAESVSMQLLDNYIDAMAGMFIGGSELYSILKAATGHEKWYGLSLNGVDSVNDLIDDIVKLANIDKEDTAKLNSQLMKTALSLCQYLGIPANNAIKIKDAIVNTITDAANGNIWSFDAGYEVTKAQQKLRDLEALGFTKEEAQRLLEEADTNGKSGISQEEMYSYIQNHKDLTEDQILGLWEAGGWKTDYATYNAQQEKKAAKAAAQEPAAAPETAPAAPAPTATPKPTTAPTATPKPAQSTGISTWEQFEQVAPVYSTHKQATYEVWEQVLKPAGISLDEYYRFLAGADTSGNNSITQDELGYALRDAMTSGMMTEDQAAAVWNSQSWKHSFDYWSKKHK